MRTTNILSIETCLAQQTGSYITGREIKQLTELDIDAMPIGATAGKGMKANLAVMQTLQAQIDEIEKSLVSYCRAGPGYRCSIPFRVSAPSWQQSFCLRPEILPGFQARATTVRIAAALVAYMSLTGREREKAIQRTAIAFWLGHMLRLQTSRFDFASPHVSFINARSKTQQASRDQGCSAQTGARLLSYVKTGEQFSVERCFS